MRTLLRRSLAHVRSLIAVVAIGFGARASADQVVLDCGLQIVRDGTNTTVVCNLAPALGTNLSLASGSSLNGPWTTMTDAAKPFVLTTMAGPTQFFRAVLMPPVGSPNGSQIEQAVRAFVISSTPGLNPATEFNIQIEPVQGLWEAMHVQVMTVRELIGGRDFNQFACLLHQGVVKPLGASVGGWGLMSGLVQGESFYYTYSWGSGVHRSHVGKLQIVNGKVKFWDSGGIFDQKLGLAFLDLFVSGASDGGVAVLRGRFDGFNRWRTDAEFGRIDESEPSPKLTGTGGGVLATLVPTEYSF